MNADILIVDDSESIREIVSRCLADAGYKVIAGVNGENGLQQLHKSQGVRLIISDLNMPVMDGITFLKEVRKTEMFRYVPVIILTTESQAAKKQEARNAGATSWIIKPFVLEKLIEIVKKVIR